MAVITTTTIEVKNALKVAGVTSSAAVTVTGGLKTTGTITTTTVNAKSSITTAGLISSAAVTVTGGLKTTATITTTAIEAASTLKVAGITSSAVVTSASTVAGTGFVVSGVTVVGTQQANEADPSTTIANDGGISTTYTQSEVEALRDAIAELQTTVSSILTKLEAHGLF